MSRSRRRTRASTLQAHPAWRQLRHPFSPQALLQAERIEAIHNMALRVLQELGIRVLDDGARDIYRQAGAQVEEQMVFIGQELVDAAIASVPRAFTLNAPDSTRCLRVEPGSLVFGPGAGCPNATDRLGGRRPGCLADYRNALKLHQSFDVIHILGPSVEPQDVPVQLRHYELMRQQLILSDKPPFVYGRGHEQVRECLEMIRLALDLDEASFSAQPWCYTVVNTNSPRQIDRPMGQALVDFARAGQLSIITPFCLAGAMAPVTVAGALTLQHAEALAAITLTQLVRPGAPVLYGGFGSNVDMRSGAPAFGTPEQIQMSLGTGQLARFLGLPWRSSAGTAANIPDMQAAGETHMALWGTLMANANFVFHAAGWLEGGLSFGFEKFINDLEALQTIASLSRPLDSSDDALAWDALGEVPPGGHFFATGHTMARYREAFYQPLVADLSNFGSWQEAGGRNAYERATDIWQRVLEEYSPPPEGDARGARIAEFIALGTGRGGAAVTD